MIRSDELQRLFEAMKASDTVPNPSSSGPSSSVTLRSNTTRAPLSQENLVQTLCADPTVAALLDGARMIQGNADAAVASADARIAETVAAMDSCTTVVSRLEGVLLVSEAELMAAEAAAKEFVSSLAAFTKKSKRTATGKRSRDTVAHLTEMMNIEDKRIAACRFRVTLCKDELSLYKQDMIYFANAGVLSCEGLIPLYTDDGSGEEGDSRADDNLASAVVTAHSGFAGHSLDSLYRGGTSLLRQRTIGTTPESQTTVSVGTNVTQSGDDNTSGARTRPNFRLVSGATHFVDEFLRKATSTASPVTEALSRFSGGAGAGVYVTDTLAEVAAGKAITAAAMASAFTNDDSPNAQEEQRRLESESLVLLQKQAMASARDARSVEQSVRELSQLTSLMNEKLVEQKEQMSIIVQNVHKAHEYTEKAVGEVGKANKAFWNSKRQLIALLWICIFSLWVANFVLK